MLCGGHYPGLVVVTGQKGHDLDIGASPQLPGSCWHAWARGVTFQAHLPQGEGCNADQLLTQAISVHAYVCML